MSRATLSKSSASKPFRILIPTVTAGGGHLQAARALEEAWRRLRPQDTVSQVDILTFTSPLMRKAYAEGYVKLVEQVPELYGHFFRKTDDAALVARMNRLRRWSARWATRRFVRYMVDFAPDAVVCPHFLPLEVLGSLSERGRRGRRFDPLTACVITDFEAHALWIEPCVDRYFVAAPETRARLVARGVDASRVAVTGIPVSERFLTPPAQAAARSALSLVAKRPTLLILGGGFGMGPLVAIGEAVDRVERDVQVLIVAGRNEKLRQSLARRAWRHPTQVFGFVSNMQDLMAASDLILSKPGGLTTSEALALGKPLLIVHPLPGQEEANSDYLLERGAASRANRVEDIPFRLGQLLAPTKLRAMARAAKALGHPDAAASIVSAVVQELR